MKALKHLVSFIIAYLLLFGYSMFIIRPIVRYGTYKEAVEKQYFKYDDKMYKIVLVDELKIPEEDKEKEE